MQPVRGQASIAGQDALPAGIRTGSTTSRPLRTAPFLFSPLRAAILPIAPLRLRTPGEPPGELRQGVYMGPAEAVQAHRDWGAEIGIASPFPVFQLGQEGFDDAVAELETTLRERRISPGGRAAPRQGQTIRLLRRGD